MQDNRCFICCKHTGQESSPPGGYIYRDKYWMVCHAPLDKGPLGTLFVESRRHILDFSDFNDEEARSFGELVRKIYEALRPQVGAQRIYLVTMMEGVPHFHAWIVPRTAEHTERGMSFLAKDMTCTMEDAQVLAAALREAMR
jgi:diadenosine tetraphosphate (Ap4A) HIT family hydrolase